MLRILDIVLSAIALVLLAPIFTLTMVLLKLTGEHEVFYLQDRIGRNGSPFRVIKFATMLKNSEAMEGGEITRRNDPRVLPLGKFLRQTKINELPQLVNIIKGDMSVVGYRPLVLSQFELYPPGVREALLSVRPGLSGVGSIVFRNEEKLMSHSELGYEECFEKVISPYKGALECWYAEHRTIVTYLKIIILTIVVVFKPDASILSRWFRNLPEPPPEIKLLMAKLRSPGAKQTGA